MASVDEDRLGALNFGSALFIEEMLVPFRHVHSIASAEFRFSAFH